MGARRNVGAAAIVTAMALSGSACAGLLNIEEGTLAKDGGASTDSAGTDGDSTLVDTGSPDGDNDSDLDTGALDGGEGGTVVPNSCAIAGNGRTDCGGGTESCCTSLPVTGGTFSRSYDGITGGFLYSTYKATVADFRLDKYETTVGRFRTFVDAVVSGWMPAAGSGRHVHLNGGSGLAASGGGYEPGWDAAWNTNLPNSKTTWDSSGYLACNSTYATWTPTAASNEQRPINCINWYQAAAFCIWDGGFLASEAEWNYAAAGGSEQRAYPWSSAYPPGSTTLSDAYAVYCGGSCASTQNVGSKSPTGNGRYGQADLAGNVLEWVLDWETDPYNETACTNCAYLTATSGARRGLRGGKFISSASYELLASFRNPGAPSTGFYYGGARCARTP